MSIDLSKLSPAPWRYASDGLDELNNARNFIEAANATLVAYGQIRQADAAFIALARNAFDGDPEALAWWDANRKARLTAQEQGRREG